MSTIAFIYVPTLHVRRANALVRLCKCTGSTLHSLIIIAISTKSVMLHT